MFDHPFLNLNVFPLSNLAVRSTIYGFINLLCPPVIVPPTKANPRDEPKAAACMVALALRRQDKKK